mmetsp:Transcript_6801/g.13493  ORF Transcript_6801/g.13493 Transcript_6801/m.13493 type:complete len:113 (-) Transcript_6801:172-510(-)
MRARRAMIGEYDQAEDLHHFEDQAYIMCFLRNGYHVATYGEALDFSIESVQFTEGYAPFGMHKAYCYMPNREFALLLASSKLASDTLMNTPRADIVELIFEKAGLPKTSSSE